MEGGSKSSPEPDGLQRRRNCNLRSNRETKYSLIIYCGFCSVSFSEKSKK